MEEWIEIPDLRNHQNVTKDAQTACGMSIETEWCGGMQWVSVSNIEENDRRLVMISDPNKKFSNCIELKFNDRLRPIKAHVGLDQKQMKEFAVDGKLYIKVVISLTEDHLSAFNLWNDTDYYDVQVQSSRSTFMLHRSILGPQSTVLAESCNAVDVYWPNRIDITDYSPRTVKAFLRCLYGCEYSLNSLNVDCGELMEMAVKCGAPIVEEKCSELLLDHIESDNCIAMLQSAINKKQFYLKHLILKHIQDISSTVVRENKRKFSDMLCTDDACDLIEQL